MDPTIVAAIISSSVALVNVLIVVYLNRTQVRNLKHEIDHWDFEERAKYPLSSAYSEARREANTPNTFDLEYGGERKALLEIWEKAQAERKLDKDSKESLFRQKAKEYQEKADTLWDSSIRGDRYRSALFYVLAAEASVLGTDLVKAGAFYHYAGMIWRTLEEWERSGDYYYFSAECHLMVHTELELKKARRALTRSMAAYEAGLNCEAYEIAKAKYEEVVDALKSEYDWAYTIEYTEDFKHLLKLAE